jgi:hypothetical protein
MKKVLLFVLLFMGCSTTKITPRDPLLVKEKIYLYFETNVAEYIIIDAEGRKFQIYGDADLFEEGQILNKIP